MIARGLSERELLMLKLLLGIMFGRAEHPANLLVELLLHLHDQCENHVHHG
jgi:hypothetical protein